ncbi:hypothetical protein IKQ21_09870 [bacterium]|nr:hypothetical protein [bacterium]
MPDKEAWNTFIKAADDADVEHLLEKHPFWQKFGKDWEKRGQELLDNILHKNPKVGNPNNVMAQSIAQSAFISPKEATPLYNVTGENSKPFIHKMKEALDDVSIGIEDWNVCSRLDKGNIKHDILIGEKAEYRCKFNQNSKTRKEVVFGHNIQNGKTRLKYSVNTPAFDASAEVFKKGSNNGAAFGYTDKLNNWSAGISADKYNAAASLDYHKRNIMPDNDLKIGFYGNWNYKKSEERVIGISCRFYYKGL